MIYLFSYFDFDIYSVTFLALFKHVKAFDYI